MSTFKLRASIIECLNNSYEIDGQRVRALPVSGVPAALREKGWRNVSRLGDESELRNIGLIVRPARCRKGGGKLARECRCVMEA